MTKIKSPYEYAEKDCDVHDAGALSKFRSKRIEWISWLNEGDNAIWKQIHAMIWNDRIFWMLNESRRLAEEKGGEFSVRSGSLGSLLDQGYFATQVLALRKLIEPPSRNPKRQIVSLRRLLDDLRANRHLFTRENYVCHDGLLFDPTEAHQRYWALRPEAGVRFEKLGGPTDYTTSQRAHGEFDALTDYVGRDWDRLDLIRDQVFGELDVKLQAAPFEKARILANKMIAHAPDTSSLPKSGLPELTFKELWACQQAICEVAGFVSTYLVQESTHGIVPIPQLDMFERWDKPFIPTVAEKELHEIWEKTAAERDAWGNENVSQMLKDMRTKSVTNTH